MQEKLNVGIVGGFQNGKSTFVNCMLDDLVARTGGEGVSVTSVNTKYVYGEMQNVEYLQDDKIIQTTTLADFLQTEKFASEITEIRVTLWKPLLRIINLIDTPGFNANDADTTMAVKSLDGLDIAIIIVNNKGLRLDSEIDIMRRLTNYNIPFYVIMNCVSENKGATWNPNSQHNKKIMQDIEARIVNSGFQPQKIADKIVVPANFLWFWYASDQYFQENADKQEELLEGIERYQSKTKDENVDRVYFRDMSNILCVRRFFDNESNWNFPQKCIHWKAMFSEILSSWENKLKSNM